jgi:hypothetical protein
MSKIVRTAMMWGGIAFAIGFAGALVVSDSNLGPLLGIFVTGPLGALAGALFAIIQSAREAGERSIGPELRWLGATWALALLYVFLTLTLPTIWLAVTPQALVLLASAFLLWTSQTRRKLPLTWRRCGVVMVIAGVVMLLLSVVPPITQPWWGSGRDQRRTAAAFPDGIPPRAVLTSLHFDASRQVPDFAVDRGQLLMEWLVVATVASIVALVIARTGRRPLSGTIRSAVWCRIVRVP